VHVYLICQLPVLLRSYRAPQVVNTDASPAKLTMTYSMLDNLTHVASVVRLLSFYFLLKRGQILLFPSSVFRGHSHSVLPLHPDSWNIAFERKQFYSVAVSD
jgi:hypothetical protein